MQHFGENPSFYGPQGYTGHPGLDFHAPIGTRIVHSRAGVVQFVGTDPQFPGRGLHFIRDNGDGTRTYGMHLSACALLPGQSVAAGDYAALSGDSGLNIFTSTAEVQVAPHYHEGWRVSFGLSDVNRGFVDWESMLR